MSDAAAQMQRAASPRDLTQEQLAAGVARLEKLKDDLARLLWENKIAAASGEGSPRDLDPRQAFVDECDHLLFRQPQGRWQRTDRTDSLGNVLYEWAQQAGRQSPGGPDLEQNIDIRFCDSLYRANRHAQRICNVLPQECCRRGWQVVYGGDDAPDDDPIGEEFKRLQVKESLLHADILARKDGSAALYLGLDDGQSQVSDPIDEKKLQRFTHLTLIERWHFQAVEWESDFTKPGFARPTRYIVTPYNPGGVAISPNNREIAGTAVVHASRMIVLDGTWLPPRLEAANAYHGDSVLQACWRTLLDYRATMRDIGELIRSFSTGVLQMKGLASMLSGGNKAAAMERLELLNVGLGVNGMALVDGEGEKLEYATRSVAGLADLLTHQKEVLAAAAEMPLTMLFGQSPSGLSTDDKAGWRHWSGRVADRQESVYTPALTRIGHLAAIAKQGPCKGVEPQWGAQYLPLEQPTEQETADLRSKQATTDQVYVQLGVLDPDEVRQSRFGGTAYSLETTLQEQLEGEAATPTTDQEAEREQAEQAKARGAGKTGTAGDPARANGNAAPQA